MAAKWASASRHSWPKRANPCAAEERWAEPRSAEKRAFMQTVACMRWGTLFPPTTSTASIAASCATSTVRRAFSPSPTIRAASTRASNPARSRRSVCPRPGWALSPWRKLALWSRDIGVAGDMLFLDLDVVVVGSIDAFFDFEPGKLAIIRDWGSTADGNSSVMRAAGGRRAASDRRLRGRAAGKAPSLFQRAGLSDARIAVCRRRFGPRHGAPASKP